MPVLWTPAQIIDIAKLSQTYAANAIGAGSLFSPELSPKLARILYVERKSLEWMYDLSPTNSTLRNVANYVYRLCGRFGLRAIAQLGNATGGGTIISPTTPGTLGINFLYLIPITAANFTGAADYNDTRIAGKQLEVFWKNIPNFQSSFGWQIIYTPTGFTVFVDDGSGGNAFDATGANADAEFDIFIVHPTGTTSDATPTPAVLPYTGIGGETSITNSLLINRTVLLVFRSTVYAAVGGSPIGLQYSFDPSIGKITFDPANPFIAGEPAIIEYT